MTDEEITFNHIYADTLERLLSEQQQAEEFFATGIGPEATAQLTESPETTTTDIPPLWEFDASFPMTIDPFLTEIREPPCQTGSAWKSNQKIVQPIIEGQISALVRDDVYVLSEIPIAV